MKWCALALVLGCSHPSAPSCEQAAERVHQVVPRFGASPELARDTVLRYCREDHWDATARTCLVAASTPDALVACIDALPPDQADRVNRAMTVTVHKRDVPMPEPDPAPARQLALHVASDGHVSIDGTTLDDAALDRTLKAVAPTTEIVIYRPKGTPASAVVAVMERAKQAGLTRLAIAPE